MERSDHDIRIVRANRKSKIESQRIFENLQIDGKKPSKKQIKDTLNRLDTDDRIPREPN